MTRRFNFLLGSALAISVVFLGLPGVAIFTRIGPGEIFRQLGTDVATDALLLSFKTSGIALGVILLVGTPAAYFLATGTFPGRNVVITILELPLVLPPAVAGIGLFAALGARGLLGGTLDAFGVQLAFTQAAVVVAVIFVASPFYVRQAIASFEALDTSLLDAARTLGAGPARTFFRVSIPLAASGLAAGATLSWARGLGEFGATILFAGSLQGVTQTAPLAIYAAFSVDTRTAQALAAVLILTSLAVLLIAKALPSWKNSNSQSAYRFGRSTSS